MKKRNIHENNTDSEMPSNECTNKEDIEKQKFDTGPYFSQKKESYCISIVQFQKCIPDTDYYELLTSLNQKQSELFTHNECGRV